VLTLSEYFRWSHVDHVHVPFRVNHDVLRLYVSVDDVPRVEILHAEDKSADVELTASRREQTDISNNIPQFHPRNKLNQEIDTLIVFVCAKELHDEAEVHTFQDLFLL